MVLLTPTQFLLGASEIVILTVTYTPSFDIQFFDVQTTKKKKLIKIWFKFKCISHIIFSVLFSICTNFSDFNRFCQLKCLLSHSCKKIDIENRFNSNIEFIVSMSFRRTVKPHIKTAEIT